MPDPLSVSDLAYLAGIIDTHAIIRVREISGGTVLPMVAVHGTQVAMMRHLAFLTGTKVTTTRRDYARAGCAEHCPEQHQHIVSESGRWSVSGAKATVLLAAVRPYLRIQGYAADEALDVGLRAPRKAVTADKMIALGWPVPEGFRSAESAD